MRRIILFKWFTFLNLCLSQIFNSYKCVMFFVSDYKITLSHKIESFDFVLKDHKFKVQEGFMKKNKIHVRFELSPLHLKLGLKLGNCIFFFLFFF